VVLVRTDVSEEHTSPFSRPMCKLRKEQTGAGGHTLFRLLVNSYRGNDLLLRNVGLSQDYVPCS
jgi:hypothetical protein